MEDEINISTKAVFSDPFLPYGLMLFPLYLVFLGICTFLVCLNQKKFKKRYKVDSIVFFLLLYLLNFLITWTFFRSLNKFFRVGLPIVLMFLISYLLNKFQIIGLTGGIAMGKSAISKFFEEKIRLPVIDCDLLARRVVEPGQPAYHKIVNHFGNSILKPDSKEIDRASLGKLIFSNNSKRRWLTKTTGWYILLEILKEIWKNIRNKNNLILLDAPLLFETFYLQFMCYPICCVYISDQDIQLKRLMERDGISDEEAMKKIKSQMPIQKKMAKSDILICNDGNQEDLIKNLNKQLIEFVM